LDVEEVRIQHCDFIQRIVTRLAQNSFSIKGWTILIMTAVFALASGMHKPEFVLIAVFPVGMFWVLDGYYLWQERLFRALYEHVRLVKDYNQEERLAMNVGKFIPTTSSWFKTMCSNTLRIFYGTAAVLVLIVHLIITKIGGN